MAKLKKPKSATFATQKARKINSAENATAVLNDAGGLSFSPKDAAQRLLTQIGVPGFNEPTYYGGQSEDKPKGVDNLSELAQSIIDNAKQVAQSEHPRDLLALANWSRNAAKCRTTPGVLLSVAAHYPETKKYLRQYVGKIVTRADQIKDFWTAYDFIFNSDDKRTFPVTLRRAINDCWAKFNESDYLKYDTQDFPTFGDILRMVNYGTVVKTRNGQKIKKHKIGVALKDWLVYHRLTNPEATPVLAHRDTFNKSGTLNQETQEHAIKSHANWEVLVSKFGNTREVWEFLIKNKLVGYMATLRNLRNILNAKITDSLLDNICEFLVSHAVGSKQLPARFFSASMAIEQGFGYGRANKSKEYNPDLKQVKKVQTALHNAIDEIRKTLPKAKGVSAIFVDNSGSMGSTVSAKSQITNAQAAAMLALMVEGSCDEIHLFAFTNQVSPVIYRPGENLITLAEKIMKARGNGGSTDAWRCPKYLREKGLHVDRIILISDMQCYNSNSYSWRGDDPEFATEFQNYREIVNGDCWLHTIDIRGNSQGAAVVDPDQKNVNCISGHSEQTLMLAMQSEGLVVKNESGEDVKQEPIASLDFIRQNY